MALRKVLVPHTFLSSLLWDLHHLSWITYTLLSPLLHSDCNVFDHETSYWRALYAHPAFGARVLWAPNLFTLPPAALLLKDGVEPVPDTLLAEGVTTIKAVKVVYWPCRRSEIYITCTGENILVGGEHPVVTKLAGGAVI